MGNVLSGTFDRNIQKTFAGINVYSKEECNKCPAKYYCSGGCAANSYNFNKDLKKPYGLSCKMMRRRLEDSLAIYCIEHGGND